jgi:hypothetical protein
LDYYTVTLTVSGTIIDIDSRDPVDPVGPSWLLDGFRLAWQVADPTRVDVVPNPAVCAFQLLAVDQSDVPDFAIGDLVTASVKVVNLAPATGPEVLAEFAGRVGAVEAEPHPRGILFSLACVDLTADLGEVYVGDEPWPEEFLFERLDRVEALAAAQGVTFSNTVWMGPGAPKVHASDVDRSSLRDTIDGLLAQVPVSTYVSYTTWLGLPRYSYKWSATENTGRTVNPLRLVETAPDFYTLVMNPAPVYPGGPFVVDACAVETAGARWRRDKGSSVSRVLVAGAFSDGTATREATHGAAHPVTERHDVDLVDASDAQALADALLPEIPFQAQRWNLEGFTIRVNDLPDVRSVCYPAVFNRHLEWETEPPGENVGQLMVVDGIAPPVSLSTTPGYYAGQVVAASLTIAAGQVRVTCSLRPTVPPQAGYIGNDGLKVKDFALTPALVDARLSQIDPTLTLYDFRLAGDPNPFD